MKKILIIILLFTAAAGTKAQISGTPAPLPSVQPVPGATTSEKSAAPKKEVIVVPSNPVPPVYPGADPSPVVIPRELVYPAATPATTQPVQKEPLIPIESTNQLKPERPQREEASRENPVNGRPASVIPDNRVNKNELRAATTVENIQQTRNNNVSFPISRDTISKSIKKNVPAKNKVRKL